MDEHARWTGWLGTADLISETAFSSNYASIWRTLTPLMDHFVRRMNMDGYERDEIPLKSTADSDRRGILNEAATRLFGRAIDRARANEELQKLDVEASIMEAALYVRGKDADIKIGSHTKAEMDEVVELCKRLRRWFSHEVKSINEIIVSPAFRGHGIVSHCHGDFLVPSGLVEIKAGDRMFRSVDYRQVAVYIALHFAATNEVFKNFMLVNPRVGVSIKVDTEVFARNVAGQSAIEFLNSLLSAFGITLVSP